MTSPLFLLRRQPIFYSGLVSALVLPPAFSLYRSRQSPLSCEAATSTSTRLSESFSSYERDAKVPIFRNGGLNRAAIGQISSGSVLGILGGLAVSTFSKTLAAVFGLSIFLVQYMASKGYNVLPTSTLQRYVKGINLRSALEDNIAFKLSFGATFALAAFASL